MLLNSTARESRKEEREGGREFDVVCLFKHNRRSNPELGLQHSGTVISVLKMLNYF